MTQFADKLQIEQKMNNTKHEYVVKHTDCSLAEWEETCDDRKRTDLPEPLHLFRRSGVVSVDCVFLPVVDVNFLHAYMSTNTYYVSGKLLILKYIREQDVREQFFYFLKITQFL